MNKIGIMQGRIIPSNLSKLQLFPQKNWQSEIRTASKIGFTDFEILFDKELLCLNEFNSNEKIEELIHIEQVNNISISSICIDYFSSYKTYTKNHRKDFFCMLDKIFNLIEKTQIKKIIIPYCDSNDINSKKDLMDVLNLFSIKNIDDALSKKSVFIAMELNLPAIEIVECFNKFNFKNIGVCFDIGNSTGNGFIAHEEILKLDSRIIHIHIKDKPLNGPNVMLGQGSADFKKCINSLKKINYKGSFILETIYKDNPKKEAKLNYNFVNNIFQNR